MKEVTEVEVRLEVLRIASQVGYDGNSSVGLRLRRVEEAFKRMMKLLKE